MMTATRRPDDWAAPERQARLREWQAPCPRCEQRRDQDSLSVIAYTVTYALGIVTGIGLSAVLIGWTF